MKKISMFLALIACVFAQAVLANSATVTALTGTATAQVGTAAPRVLRVGDEVQQGVTVSTGPASSATLRFSDGQIAALTSNTKLQITTYDFQPQTGTGNVLLSLINGGMRAVTGLIGKVSPTKVSYRAATATIGIRGTETDLVTDGTSVGVSQISGTVSFSAGGETRILGPFQAAYFVIGRPIFFGVRNSITFPPPLQPLFVELNLIPPFSGPTGGAGGAGSGGDSGPGTSGNNIPGVGGSGAAPGGGGGSSTGVSQR